MARVEQLLDDTLDWRHDAERGLGNLILAEWRRRAADEPLEVWALREGLPWALETAAGWLAPVAARAAALESRPAADFIAGRVDYVDRARAELEPARAQLDRLTRAFGSDPA